MGEKSISVRIDEKLHKLVRRRIASLDLSYKDYITKLITDDLNGNSNKTEFMAEKSITCEQLVQARTVLELVQKQMFGGSEEK